MDAVAAAAPLRVLIPEDPPEDAALLHRALRAGGIAATGRVVANERAFRAALAEFAPALILADLGASGFGGQVAVTIAREWAAAVPCILVSGAPGEDRAVAALRGGVSDCEPVPPAPNPHSGNHGPRAPTRLSTRPLSRPIHAR